MACIKKRSVEEAELHDLAQNESKGNNPVVWAHQQFQKKQAVEYMNEKDAKQKTIQVLEWAMEWHKKERVNAGDGYGGYAKDDEDFVTTFKDFEKAVDERIDDEVEELEALERQEKKEAANDIMKKVCEETGLVVNGLQCSLKD